MSNELPEKPSRDTLINMLRTTTVTRSQLQDMRNKYGLTAEWAAFNAAQREAKDRTENFAALGRLYNEANSLMTKATAALTELAQTIAATRVLEEVKPGWIDEEFLALFPEEYRRSIAKLNLAPRPNLLDANDRGRMQRAAGQMKEGSYSEQFMRAANLLYPLYSGERHNGYHGTEYSLTMAQSETVANEACNAWRSGETGHRFYVRDYTAVVHEDYVEIGCQNLSKAEVTRVAALMGWGGFEKQEGPEIYPSHLPLKDGQRYTLRDGRVATVKVSNGFGNVTVDEKEVGVVYADTGTSNKIGAEAPFDVVGPEPKQEVSTPLFPLKEGQRVLTRAGRELTVGTVDISVSTGRPRAALLDGVRVIVRVYADDGMRYSSKEENPLDVVALVEPKLEFPLKAGLRVRQRDGSIAYTVPGYSSDVVGLSREPGGTAIAYRFTSDGRGNHAPGNDTPQDIVALAPEETETETTGELILPVQVGQRVRLRNGEERTVVLAEDGGLVSYRRDDGTVQNRMVYTRNGSGYGDVESPLTAPESRRNEMDIVATITHPFPIETGDTVRYRNGQTHTVSRVDSGGVAWMDDEHAVWVRNGLSGADTAPPNDRDVTFILTRRVEQPVAA